MTITENGTTYNVTEYRPLRAGDWYIGVKDGVPTLMITFSDHAIYAFVVERAEPVLLDSDAYWEGGRAHSRGLGLGDNPYRGKEAEEWYNGWHDEAEAVIEINSCYRDDIFEGYGDYEDDE